MGNYELLKTAIQAVITSNGNNEITGEIMRNVLTTIVSTIGGNYTFAGIATPATNPGTPDANVFYIAAEGGTYSNFGGAVLSEGITILAWNGTWTVTQLQTIDTAVTENSDNLITSGAVFNVVNALASGAKVSLSVSPSTIYRGEAQSITLTATMSNATPTSLTIKDGATTLKTGATSPQTHTMSVTQTAASHTYTASGVTLGVTLNGSATLSAYYPVYYGFGANASGVAVAGNKYPATNTAKHTYTKTASTSGQHFYILVPTGIANPTTFSMGGAPFVMTSSSATISGISYTVFTSGNTYNSGTEVSVTAA